MSEYFEGTVYVKRHRYGEPKPEKWTMREGETSNLVQLGFHTKKYTHHPIAVVHELMEDKRFRHLSIERLHKLVAMWGPTRSQSWPTFYYNDLDDKLDKIQIDPKKTVRPVAILGGLSCMCCDGMAWEAPVLSEEDSYWMMPSGVTDRFSETVRGQFIFYTLCDDWDEALPALCPQCLAKTYRVRRKDYHFRYDKIHALKCLAEITKQTIGANNENRPSQSRKRRINSRQG